MRDGTLQYCTRTLQTRLQCVLSCPVLCTLQDCTARRWRCARLYNKSATACAPREGLLFEETPTRLASRAGWLAHQPALFTATSTIRPVIKRSAHVFASCRCGHGDPQRCNGTQYCTVHSTVVIYGILFCTVCAAALVGTSSEFLQRIILYGVVEAA